MTEAASSNKKTHKQPQERPSQLSRPHGDGKNQSGGQRLGGKTQHGHGLSDKLWSPCVFFLVTRVDHQRRRQPERRVKTPYPHKTRSAHICDIWHLSSLSSAAKLCSYLCSQEWTRARKRGCRLCFVFSPLGLCLVLEGTDIL